MNKKTSFLTVMLTIIESWADDCYSNLQLLSLSFPWRERRPGRCGNEVRLNNDSVFLVLPLGRSQEVRRRKSSENWSKPFLPTTWRWLWPGYSRLLFSSKKFHHYNKFWPSAALLVDVFTWKKLGLLWNKIWWRSGPDLSKSNTLRCNGGDHFTSALRLYQYFHRCWRSPG